jgi:hypothetical protein
MEDWRNGHWYAQRDRGSKRLKFLRWSTRGFNACMFFGYLNHLRMADFNWGWEFSLTIKRFNAQVGIALPNGWNPLYWKLNPHMTVGSRRWWRVQRSGKNFAVRMGWLCLGCELPERLFRWLDQREFDRQEALMEAWAAQHPEEHEGSCGERMDSADLEEN